MDQEADNELISARLVRISWWRQALGRLGVRRRRRHEQTFERLAASQATDAVAEEQVKSLLATLERESTRPPKGRTRR
jgi:hypothetical protein